MSLPDQHVLSHHIEVKPHAGSWIERTDYFGAKSVFVTVEGPSQELRIDCRSCVNVIRSVAAKARADRAWDDVRDEAFATSALIAASPIHYLFPSRAVPLSDLTTAYARQSFPAGRGILSGGVDLMHRIRADFVYNAKATQVSTPLLEAFERRH